MDPPLVEGVDTDVEALFPSEVVGPELALAAIEAGGPVSEILGVGDLDGDGKDEVAIVVGAGVAVWRGASVTSGGDLERWTLLDGAGVSAAGDVDQDGFDDLVAGTPEDWVVYRGPDLAPWARIAPSEGLSLRHVGGGRDVDGDDVPDLVTSEYRPDNGRAREEVRVWSGADIGAGLFSAGDGAAAYGAVVDDDGSGPASIALADFDDDGLADIATGAVRNFAAVHMASSLGGSTGLSDQEIHLHTCHPDEACPNGTWVGATGDVDGDGIEDLLVVGSHGGGAWAVPGDTLMKDGYHTQYFGGTMVTAREIEGAAALVGVGDLDASGLADVVASDGTAAWLLTGNAIANETTIPVEAALHRFEGFAPEGGLVVGAIGDVDGDGTPDLAFGDADGTIRIVLTPGG